MSTRWGEIPMDPDTEPGIAAIEREHITKPRPMELDGPLLHQPVKQELPGPSEVPIECTFGDPLILHTIQLNQHAKKMRTLLNSLQLRLDNPQKQLESESQVAFLPTMPVLEFPDKELVHKSQLLDRCFNSKFRQGIGEPPPEINEQLAKKILRKALAVICAHAGFETTTESILEILVDVTSEFYLKLTRLLRTSVDRETLAGGNGFPDALEEVFYGIGIGSMRNLMTFYQTHVINYHRNLLQTCRQLNSTYKQLKSPDLGKESDEKKQIKIKVKEENATQIMFPIIDEQDDGLHTDAPSLHLDDLPNLQITFEHDAVHISTEEDVLKTEQIPRSDPMLQLATNDVPNLYPDEEIPNIIDQSPVQPHDTEAVADSHLAAMLDQPHTPINLDMKLFKGKKGSLS